jgi:arabinogalactan endo-1,4-beta-galactosidase
MLELRLEEPLASGVYDPVRDEACVVGEAPFLGCWSTPLPLETTALGGRLTLRLSGLSDQELRFKFVLRNRASGELRWEDGPDRVLRRQGDEPDRWPAPFGDGVPELESGPLWWSRPAGWRPGTLSWGADLSSLPRLQALGAVFTDGPGEPAEPLSLLRERGWSLLRLRLWHTPAEAWQGLDSVTAFAARATAAGFGWILDPHFSDDWADPGQQTPPAAWQGLSGAVLEDSVRAHVRRALAACAALGATPAWIQLGNEIDGGLLWPAGAVGGEHDTPAQWAALGGLLRAAAEGVELAHPDGDGPRRLVHLANSGSGTACARFLDSLVAHDVPFEGIGLSYYPWWHGGLDDLAATLSLLAGRFGRELWVVETAYPFTLDWADPTHNIVGLEEQLLPGLPATPAGQAEFLRRLRTVIAGAPQGLGRGLIPWEPLWTAVGGSPWENLCLVDFGGAALPALALPGDLDPAAPQLAIRRLTGGLLELVWESDPAASGWRVEGALHPGGPWSPLADTTEPRWTTAPIGQQGWFRVRALGAPPIPSGRGSVSRGPRAPTKGEIP